MKRGTGYGECVSPFAPPVMQLHSENLLHRFSSFRFATYTRTVGFCLKDKSKFRPVARQNPSVLRSPESACFPTEQPLSADRGRKRSNTLDFPTENRVPTGRFRPYWKPRSQGTRSPFTIPAVLRSVPTNWKREFVPTYLKTRKSPQPFLR